MIDANKVQESTELFEKYGWRATKTTSLGSIKYTTFVYKDGFDIDMPETMLEQPMRVRRDFIPALIGAYKMVSGWTLKEPMSYQRLFQYIKDKPGMRPVAADYAYLAAAEYLKKKGFDFYHDYQKSALEQEWGPLLKQASPGEPPAPYSADLKMWEKVLPDVRDSLDALQKAGVRLKEFNPGSDGNYANYFTGDYAGYPVELKAMDLVHVSEVKSFVSHIRDVFQAVKEMEGDFKAGDRKKVFYSSVEGYLKRPMGSSKGRNLAFSVAVTALRDKGFTFLMD